MTTPITISTLQTKPNSHIHSNSPNPSSLPLQNFLQELQGEELGFQASRSHPPYILRALIMINVCGNSSMDFVHLLSSKRILILTANTKRNMEPEVPQVHVDPLIEKVLMSNYEPLSKYFSRYDGQANREAIALVNPNVGMAAIRVKDFTRMNPIEFYGSKFDEDHQVYADEIYKIVEIMGVVKGEKGGIDHLPTQGC
uniref:Uncharacterized protein n=1 Tax=Solanum tuberosum TaxID=4113 RepID=M1DUW9_SOLTU